MNIITDMNKSPWGSVINEREIWVEEIERMCHDRRIEVEDEKRYSLEGSNKEEKRNISIDARKGAMVTGCIAFLKPQFNVLFKLQ